MNVFLYPFTWLLLLLIGFVYASLDFSKKSQDIIKYFLFTFLSFLFVDSWILLLISYSVLLYFTYKKKKSNFFILLIFAPLLVFKSGFLVNQSLLAVSLLSFSTFFTLTAYSYYKQDIYPSSYFDFYNQLLNPLQNYSGPVRENFKNFNATKVKHTFYYFLIGFFSKFYVHDHMTYYYNDKLLSPENYNSFEILLLVCSAKVFVYTNLFGYTTMTYAILKFFGLNSLISFNRPFSSTNIIDFWRRWQIPMLT